MDVRVVVRNLKPTFEYQLGCGHTFVGDKRKYMGGDQLKHPLSIRCTICGSK